MSARIPLVGRSIVIHPQVMQKTDFSRNCATYSLHPGMLECNQLMEKTCWRYVPWGYASKLAYDLLCIVSLTYRRELHCNGWDCEITVQGVKWHRDVGQISAAWLRRTPLDLSSSRISFLGPCRFWCQQLWSRRDSIKIDCLENENWIAFRPVYLIHFLNIYSELHFRKVICRAKSGRLKLKRSILKLYICGTPLCKYTPDCSWI
jgi:hypothetical protein